MKIYVDELPKNCKECPLYRSGGLKIQKYGRYVDAEACVLGNYYKLRGIDDEIDTCPLETIQSLKKQIREEAIDEVIKSIDDKFNCLGYIEENFENIKKYILEKIKGEN